MKLGDLRYTNSLSLSPLSLIQTSVIRPLRVLLPSPPQVSYPFSIFHSVSLLEKGDFTW